MFHARQQDLLILHHYSHAQDGITRNPLLGLTKYWTPEASVVWSAAEVMTTIGLDTLPCVPSASHVHRFIAGSMLWSQPSNSCTSQMPNCPPQQPVSSS